MRYAILIFVLIQTNVFANTHHFSYKLSDSLNLNFKLFDFTPQENTTQKYPLIIFLHGKGECGQDNKKQMHHLNNWLPDSLKLSKYNCYLLAPQIPVNYTWSYYNKHEQILSFTDSCPLVQQILLQVTDSIINQFNIDVNRIYLMGISMGAFGITDIVCRNPTKFAAAIAISGGGAPTGVNQHIQTIFWLMHGKKDATVGLRHTLNFYHKISQNNPNKHILTIYENTNHAAWIKGFKEKELLSWLFSVKRQ